MNRILLTNGMRKYLLMAALMLTGVMTAQGQAVIMNGNYFLTHNEAGTTVNTAATNTFNPATCLWNINNLYIRTADSDGNAFDGNNYLQASQNSVSLGGSSQWQQAADNQTLISARTGGWWIYTYYYLRLNSTTWQIGTSNSNNGTAYAVDISSGTTTSTNPTISGSDVITATGNTTYTASGAAYQQGGYTDYYFNSAHHYFNGNTSITPANATLTYAWSLEDNAYATVNNSGVVTVTSLPEYDITLTLTVTATATGGTPAAPAGTTLTASKEITIQGTKPAAPTISVSGTTVTLSTTAVGSTTIRYTLDGTDPTASTGTVYSGAIDLSGSSTSPVTIKAITVRNGNASEVTEQTVTLTLPTPTITINGEAKTATISSSVAGATIYYTTDGTTPTTSSSQYTGTLTGLAYMTNVKAIAVKDGWNNSPEASGIVTIPSGVSGDVVTLFDYEPHSWSYYSDPQCPIRSLNPADVKITYYGNGQTANNMTTTDDDNTPNTFGALATGVQVSATETANTFVYYKTLERTNGEGAASKAAANGPAMYTTIPNPFQKRPIIGSIPTSRTVYLITTGNNSGRGTLTVNYTNASGVNATETVNINSNNFSNTRSIQVKVGTSISCSLARTKGTVYTVGRYDANNGTQIWNFNRSSNGTTTNSYTAGADLSSFTGFRGFYAWRVKSKSSSITSITDINGNAFANNIIPAEAEIRINTSSEYGNEIEFEALWAQAYVTTGTGDLGTKVPAGVTSAYERNFHVVTGDDDADDYQKSYPLTVSAYYPNGTSGGGSISGGFTAAADTKFEDIEITGATNSTWTAAGHDLIIGRGCSGTINYVRGVSDNTTAPNYTLRIESGTINYLSFLRGYSTTTGTATDNGSTLGGTPNVKGVLGCDYDRATNSGITNNLIVTNGAYYGYGVSENNTVYSEKSFVVHVKSGKIGNSFTINNSYTADAAQAFYIGIAANRVRGHRILYMEGGEVASIAGGIDATQNENNNSVTVRMTGGHVRGAVYGAAARSAAYGNRNLIVTGGSITGWIGGGCNGEAMPTGGAEDTYGGVTNGATKVYFGGTATCGGTGSNVNINGSVGGIVFGAGKGVEGNTTSGRMAQGTTVVVADKCDIERNVYGGGNFGYAQTSTDVYVSGGTVHGSVFGGSNQNNGPEINITMIGGLIEGGLYGGSNETGNISGNVTVQIDGGQVGTPSQNANVHGGGLGNATRTLNNVYVNIGSRTDCNVSGSAVIYGDVYGGSAEGKTNGNTARENSSVTNVTLNKGTIYGSLYGGGLGSTSPNYAADVYGPVAVKVYGGTLTGGVYGANNVKGAPQSSVTVDIYGTDPQPAEGFAIANVYGGGNQAAYANNSYPTVTVHNCNNSIGNVYGGGNAAAVTNTNVTIYGGNRIGAVYAGGNGTGVGSTFQMVTGNAVANIYGGTIDRVFAGNNSSGIVNGDKTVTIDAGTNETTNAANCITCGNSPMKIGAVFHGGNQAAGSAGTVDIVCTGATTAEYIDTLFGGANNADIIDNDMSTAEDITLNIDRGYIRSGIFGGNNSGGAVTGDITINLTRNSGGTCAFDYPSVFGGGYGAGTSTGGDIEINIGEKSATNTAPTINATIAGGAVYGGSALGSVNGSSSNTTTINIYNCTVSTGNIYGGGLGEAGNATKGMVNGTVQVNISTEDQTEPNCAIDLRNSSIFGCNNTGGSPQSDVRIDVWKTGFLTDAYSSASTGTLYAIKEVFGGGNLADYEPAGDNKATVYIHNCVNTIEDVYGGGNAAAAKGVVTTIEGGRFDYIFGGGNGVQQAADIGSGGTNLTVNAGRINHLFGGSNTNGTISGPMRTNVNYSKMNTDGCDELIIEFFGGGNLAEIGTESSPVNLSTTIECNTVFSAIYGGSNLADIYGDVTLTINGGTIGEAYGGSKGRSATSDPSNAIPKAADIHGNVKLNIYGGAIGRAYGGSNINGNITGTIGVDLDWQGDCPGKSIDYIYGGSNQAAYTPTVSGALGPNFSPTVKLINGTVNYNVYGGGRGGSAIVTANPKVIAGDGTTPTNNANVQGDIFGGGDAAAVTGSTNVIVTHNTPVGGNVFGGGNAAAIQKNEGVGGSTEVLIEDKARVYGNVYGGGNQGEVEGNTKVIVNGN